MIAGAVTWTVVLVALRATVALPEACPRVTAGHLDGAIDATIDWFADNQDPDGSFAYRVGADGGRRGGYSEVRHAGVLLSLYQAADSPDAPAFGIAERGLGWARGALRVGDGWTALAGGGPRISAGASALLLAALAERAETAADGARDHGGLMTGLGRFLIGQVEPDGAVLAYFEDGSPLPGVYSRFFTGETFWALARLHTLVPEHGAGPAAVRVGRYLAADRDRVERRIPPVHDHWAAYGLDEVLRVWERTGVAGPADAATAATLGAYARRLAGYLATAARFQAKDAPAALEARVGGPPRGAARGTTGEGLAALWRLGRAGLGADHLRDALAGHVLCTAGLLLREQSDGAWYHRGETRMDDQQHALSALLAARDVLDGGRG